MKKSLLIISVFVAGLANGFAQNCEIGLTSAVGTNLQTVCKGVAITPITYTVTGSNVSTSYSTTGGIPLGISGTLSAGVYTISGTPSSVGVITYTVTTSGTCNPDAQATGTLTVNGATLTLTSAVGSNNQAVSKGAAIASIAYQVGGTATGATVSALPAGITSSFSAGIRTISGSSTVAGGKTYTVTTTGGACPQISEMFDLTILSCTTDPAITPTGTSPKISPDTSTIIIKTPGEAFSQTFTLYVPTATDIALMGFNISATIDSVKLKDVGGLPAGLTRTCGTPDCVAAGGQIYCFTITGTMPMDNDTLYKLAINMAPFGLLNPPFAAIAPGGPTIQGAMAQNNVDGFPLATFKVQVGTPRDWTISGIEDFEAKKLEISQNIPNPFDGSTVINFNCPVSGKVDFVVVDVLGRKVYDTNINATAGANTFTFNTDLANGTYFFSVSDGTNTITKKMVIAGE